MNEQYRENTGGYDEFQVSNCAWCGNQAYGGDVCSTKCHREVQRIKSEERRIEREWRNEYDSRDWRDR